LTFSEKGDYFKIENPADMIGGGAWGRSRRKGRISPCGLFGLYGLFGHRTSDVDEIVAYHAEPDVTSAVMLLSIAFPAETARVWPGRLRGMFLALGAAAVGLTGAAIIFAKPSGQIVNPKAWQALRL